jgi:hypothetical protein
VNEEGRMPVLFAAENRQTPKKNWNAPTALSRTGRIEKSTYTYPL